MPCLLHLWLIPPLALQSRRSEPVPQPTMGSKAMKQFFFNPHLFYPRTVNSKRSWSGQFTHQIGSLYSFCNMRPSACIRNVQYRNV
ncbi:hypothetical protein F4859DRAFT_463929, partial [Xylaria cf. heliscus]